MKKKYFKSKLALIDFVPAISGLIGKIALVSSFAFVWAQELGIFYPNFIYLNVRLELIIASAITLIVALVFSSVSPPGTLAPLIVLIPFMTKYGAHPLILSILVGIIGIVAIRTGLFQKLYNLSGFKSKSALGLVFGLSGIMMSTSNLYNFFDSLSPLIILIIILTIVYIALYKFKRIWLIIPISAVVALAIAYIGGYRINFAIDNNNIVLNPSYWWNNVWNIGYGLDISTILVTIPFAIFIVILWSVDTLSIFAIKEDYNPELNLSLNQSFYTVSLRNMIGGVMGGAQTASIWRSYLIPLFMTKREIKQSAIIMGVVGLVAGFLGYPVLLLSFTPLIWSVLLFGIFLPLAVTGAKNLFKMDVKSAVIIIIFSTLGIIFNPVITWAAITIYEQITRRLSKKEQPIN